MLTLELVATTEEFRLLEKEWNHLLSQSSADTIFLTWEWLYTWWEVYGNGKTLQVLLARDNGSLVGIAPLFIDNGSKAQHFAPATLRFLGSQEVNSDYLDIICQPGYEQAAVETFVLYLEDQRHLWQVWSISDIPKHSVIRSQVLRLATRLGTVEERQHTVCPYLELPTSWDELVSNLSRNLREQIRRRQRQLEKEGEMAYKSADQTYDTADVIDVLIPLHRDRMERKGLAGAFDDPQFLEFHKRVSALFHVKGWFHFCSLSISDKPIACLYNFIYGDKLYYYQSGLDTTWERLSPGMVLFAKAMEEAIGRGLHEFDFLQGDETYKFRWANGQRLNMAIDIYRSTPRAQAKRWSRRFRQSVKSIVKPILARSWQGNLNR